MIIARNLVNHVYAILVIQCFGHESVVKNLLRSVVNFWLRS